jgi:hypothetical protein
LPVRHGIRARIYFKPWVFYLFASLFLQQFVICTSPLLL